MFNYHKIINFFKEARVELSKVVWPKRPEIVRNTWMVILVSLGVAFFLGILDYIFSLGIGQFFNPQP